MKRFSQTNSKPKTFSQTKEIIKLSAVAFALTLGIVTINQLQQPVAQAEIDNGLTAHYFSNMGLSGDKLIKKVNKIDFDWDYSSPFTNNEPFSARWQGQILAEHSEEYTFTTFSDDGVRLWVNNKLIIDNWTDHPRTENYGNIALAAGQKYDIKLEYYEHTERAVMKLYWQSASQPKEIIPTSNLFVASALTSQIPPLGEVSGSQTPATHGLVGKYYNDTKFAALQNTRTDNSINFDWGYDSPGNGINAESISIRWEGQVMPRYSEEYTFHTISDDGVRLWVNDQLVIHNWSDHPATENTGKIALQANQKYNIKLEYFERSGHSVIKLLWSSKSQQREVIPANQLFTATSGSAAPVTQIPVEPQPTPAPATPVPVQPTIPPIVSDILNPLSGLKLYISPYSQAQNWVNQNQQNNLANAALVETIAKQPQATWLGGWNSNVYSDVQHEVNAASGSGAIPTFVVYNIPNRDCGQHSAGGASTSNDYKNWIGSIASGIGSKKAIVILEPDALTLTSCLDDSRRTERFELIKSAVATLKSQGNVAVYLDAGHPRWVNPVDMANLLKQAGVNNADGFALNTSNFITTSENISYGEKISGLTGGKHFVIDTSRNGNGTNGEWCNPWGRRIGNTPTTNTGNKLVDAFLWVKRPGESDGTCNGGPSAGQFWPDYAISLVK